MYSIVFGDGAPPANNAPTVTPVNISNSESGNYTNGTLTGQWTYADSDSDPEVYNETSWFKDDAVQSSLANLTVVNSGNTSAGEVWIFSVRANDGTDWSSWVNSSGHTIQAEPANNAPVIITSRIDPTTPNTTDDLDGYCNATDADGDNVTYCYSWFLNGVLNLTVCDVGEPAIVEDDSSDASNCVGNWNSTYTCANVDDSDYDTYGTSDFGSEASLRVNYTKPAGVTGATWEAKYGNSTGNVTVNTTIISSCFEQDNLQLLAESSNFDGGDTVTDRVRLACWDGDSWEIILSKVYYDRVYDQKIFWTSQTGTSEEGVEIKVDTLSSIYTSKGEVWNFSCLANDGTDNSTWGVNDSVTIQNVVPSLPTQNSPADESNVTTTSVLLNCSGSTDGDGDSLNYTYWGDSTDGTTLLGINDTENTYNWTGLSNGIEYTWKCGATDGEDYSSNTSLWNFTIVLPDTTPPIFSNHLINPDPPNEDQNVEINVTVSESVDTVKLEFNNTNYTISTNISNEWYFTINSGNYSAGENMTYYWWANDTSGNQNTSNQQSFIVASGNTAPVLETVRINPTPTAYSNQTLEGFWNASDTDGDTVTVMCNWSINGVHFSTDYYHEDVGQALADAWANNTKWDNSDDVTYLNDSDWTTYASNDYGSGDSYLWMNYTKQDTYSGATWNIKDSQSGGVLEIDISTEHYSCWSQNENVLELRAHSERAEGWWECYNGTDWHNLRHFVGYEMFEENITWHNITYVTQNVEYDGLNISSDLTSKGQAWNFTCKALDINGDWSNELSGNITVINMKPEAHNLTLVASDAPNNYTTADLTGSYDFYDIDDEDSEQFWETNWFVDGSHNTSFDNKTIVLNGNTTKAEVYIFSARVFDGYEWSVWVNSTSLTILNTPPTTPTQNSPADESNVTTTSVLLNCSGTTDDDNDAINYTYWGDSTDGTTLLGINDTENTYNWTGLSDGEYTWKCGATDGEDYSSNTSLWNFTVVIPENPTLNLEWVYPTSDIDVLTNTFFNVSVNLTCLSDSCTLVNTSLYNGTIVAGEDVTWNKTFAGADGSDSIYRIVADSNDNIYVAGLV